MTDRLSLRLTADAVVVSTPDGEDTAIGPIEAQDREWWEGVRHYASGRDTIPVVLDTPESYAVRLPRLPRTRRETDALLDGLAPIRRRYLTITPARQALDGDITVTIAHAERLRSLRETFARNDVPPPLFFAPDGIGAFEQPDPGTDRASRVTAIVVLAAILAMPVLTALGAAVLTDRIDRNVAVLAAAQQANIAARKAFGELAATSTVAARIAAVARRLPNEGATVAIADAGARRVAITVDAAAPDRSRRALERAGTLRNLREVSRTRTRDGYRITYVGVPQ